MSVAHTVCLTLCVYDPVCMIPDKIWTIQMDSNHLQVRICQFCCGRVQWSTREFWIKVKYRNLSTSDLTLCERALDGTM